MDWFPIFVNLRGASCLVVGAGGVALRKIGQLLEAGAIVVVVAPKAGRGVADLAAAKQIRYLECCFHPDMVKGHRLVVSATEHSDVNRAVAEACTLHGVLVNIVDDGPRSDFIMPAIVDRSPLLVAVSSGGKAPVLARHVKALIDDHLPAGIGRLADLMGAYRDTVKKHLGDITMRRRFWERVIESPIAKSVLDGNESEARGSMLKLLDRTRVGKPQGEVYLVGAGPGDRDLLTLKAARLMQQCDVVLHDCLVSPEILASVRPEAERINVGKPFGSRGMSQARINELMVSLAREGKRVLRLKSGDPIIFGRGGEEMAALAEARVAFQVVPGITAASGCAAYAGIPLTHRDLAHSCTLITGTTRDGRVADMDKLSPGQTVVFYMPLPNIQAICDGLSERGFADSTPTALISRGTTVRQQIFTAPLGSLQALIAERRPPSPCLLIVGDVVRLRALLSQLNPVPVQDRQGEAETWRAPGLAP